MTHKNESLKVSNFNSTAHVMKRFKAEFLITHACLLTKKCRKKSTVSKCKQDRGPLIWGGITGLEIRGGGSRREFEFQHRILDRNF